jgi:hypothetical protein
MLLSGIVGITSTATIISWASMVSVLKVHLNIVIARIEALIISGNKFLYFYACVEEVCYL